VEHCNIPIDTLPSVLSIDLPLSVSEQSIQIDAESGFGYKTHGEANIIMGILGDFLPIESGKVTIRQNSSFVVVGVERKDINKISAYIIRIDLKTKTITPLYTKNFAIPKEGILEEKISYLRLPSGITKFELALKAAIMRTFLFESEETNFYFYNKNN